MAQLPILIVLAGGASSRMWPLREKSLLRFGTEPLLVSQLRRYESLGLQEAVIVGNSGNLEDIKTLTAASRSMQSLVWGQAQQWLEKKFQFQVENISIETARKEAQDKGLQEITEDLGKDFLGEERFVKNRSLITARIFNNSAKYVPFSKTSVLESKGNIHTIQVDLKSSPASFRQLLQDQGLLSQGEAQPVVMPYIL